MLKQTRDPTHGLIVADDRLVDFVGELEAELLAEACISRFSGRMSPMMRSIVSSRPTWMQAAEQLGAEPLALEAVADEEGELGLVDAVELAQPADAEDLAAPVAGSLRSATSAISRS